MSQASKSGASFGLTTGVITTLGLMVGLNSGTHLKSVVISGIITIAIADAFADSLGMHISEESRDKGTKKDIWIAAVSTFITKLLFTLTFLIPILLFSLKTAMIVSIAWGLLALGFLSYFIAKQRKTKPLYAIFEHITIAAVVIILAQLVGNFVSNFF